MRIPDCGPLGETFFEARDLTMVAESRVNRPGGGKVETVLTPATHLLFRRLFDRLALCRLRFVKGMWLKPEMNRTLMSESDVQPRGQNYVVRFCAGNGRIGDETVVQ